MTLQKTSYFITAAVIFSLVPIFAQEPKKGENQQGQSDALLRLETELVQIDVVVSGKDGKLIRDLKREDFELFEDAKKQQISHFAAGTASNPASWLRIERKPLKEGKTAITPTEIRSGRYLVLAVDDFHLSPGNLLLAKRVLQRFINEQMVANDQVAVVTTSGNIGLFQQFSSEREVLEHAINRLSVQTRRATSPSDIPRITDYQAELIDRGDRAALELAVAEIQRLEPMPQPQAGGGRRPPASGAISFSSSDRAVIQAQSKARMIVAQNANYTRTTLSTLEGVIRSLQTLPGRKILVMLSDGFYLGGNSSSQLYDLRRIIDAATRAGVVIYSIDARGLVAEPPGGGASESGSVDIENPGVRERIEARAVEAMRDGMFSLAHDTGGKAFFNNNDLNLGLQRVLDDNEVYYVLAYEPPESRRDGRFHKIDVKIAGRPDLIVRTRKGYLADNENKLKAAEKSAEKQKEVSPEKAAKEAREVKAAQIRTGLSSLFPLRDIPVSMTCDFIDIAKAGSSALITAHIDTSSLDLEQIDGTHKGRVDMTVAFFDEKGKPANIFTDVLVLNLKPEGLEIASKFGFSYYKLVPLKPGFYQARIAAREERTARMGSSAAWVEIPDLKRKELTLSGVLMTAGDDPQIAQNEIDPKVASQLRSSTGNRRFKRGSKIDFLVFAYNGKIEKGAPDLVIQSQVFSGSKLVYASPLAKMTIPENSDPQRVPYAARISLEGFGAGQYELRLMSIDRLTKATAYRRVNFTVE